MCKCSTLGSGLLGHSGIIERNRLRIDDLAKYTSLSPSHLSKLFKKEVGISISEYIREQKISTAQNLLIYSELSLIEITNHLGFASQSHFI